MKKVDDLKARIEEENPDIVGITETWLNSAILDNELHIDNYNIIRKDRCDKKKGGGVMLMIKQGIGVEELDSNENTESIWCKIENLSNNICLGLCYRPPNSSNEYNSLLCDEIKQFTSKNSVILGDFNYPDIDWEAYSGNSTSEEFRDICLDRFLHQHVHDPTRGENILDLVLSTSYSLVSGVSVTSPLGNSDHAVISFDIAFCNQHKLNKRKAPNVYKADFLTIRQHEV